MPHAATNIDAVFRALSDPTRREVVARLAHGPRSVSELAAPFDMKLPSFVRHLKLLEQAGLVRSEKRGRVHVSARTRGADHRRELALRATLTLGATARSARRLPTHAEG